MDTLLVAGTAVAGLFIGGALDPLGQRWAELSRLEDERRRADQLAADGQTVDHSQTTGSVMEHVEVAAEAAMAAAESDDADDPTPEDRTVRNLLPSGPSPLRMLGSALVTGFLFGAAAEHFGRDLILAPFCVFFAMLVAVSVTDLSHRLVPRRLIYSALVLIAPLLVATAGVDGMWHSLSGAVIGGAVAFGLFFVVWWFIPQGMGFGDVRLSGVIGLTVGYLSLLHVYVAFLAGFLIGSVFGLVLMAVFRAGRKARIPFGPSLAAGAVIAVFWGGHVAQSLFHASS